MPSSSDASRNMHTCAHQLTTGRKFYLRETTQWFSLQHQKTYAIDSAIDSSAKLWSWQVICLSAKLPTLVFFHWCIASWPPRSLEYHNLFRGVFDGAPTPETNDRPSSVFKNRSRSHGISTQQPLGTSRAGSLCRRARMNCSTFHYLCQFFIRDCALPL